MFDYVKNVQLLTVITIIFYIGGSRNFFGSRNPEKSIKFNHASNE